MSARQAEQKHGERRRRLKYQLAGVETRDGAGVRLKRVLSVNGHGDSARLLDPFLMLDEFASANADDYIGGFPDHPHRGFETVTYMLEGMMEYRDHLGNQGQPGATRGNQGQPGATRGNQGQPGATRGNWCTGSVQWMTAGSGIIHSEMPRQQQGVLRGFQLWINLPARGKMRAPAYREFSPEQMPWSVLEQGGRIRMIAGQLQQNGTVQRGPVTGIPTAPVYADVHLPAGACPAAASGDNPAA